MTQSQDHSEKVGHTPGPWVRDKYGSLRGGNGREVNVRGLGIGTLLASGTYDEAEANATLIAAAPTMLKAGSKMVAALSVAPDEVIEGAFGADILEALTDLRAAIRLATGEAE